MRWDGRRWFSLTSTYSRQALFTPYMEPMNKGQEKSLRKVLLRNEPKLHPRIPHNIDRLLQLHSPKITNLQKRKETIIWLNDLISSTFGKQFSVQDVSLHQYAHDLKYAPLELAIVDDSRSSGFPPGTEDESRIGPYDPMLNLIKSLQEHGLTGTIIDGDAFNLIAPIQAADVELLEPPIVYPSWSEPEFFEVPYVRYPAVLHAQGKDSLLPFNLSPPAPTLIPLNELFRKYFHTDLYKKLVTFIYYWTQTIGMGQLSPTCVALMVIVFLQTKRGFPILQKPDDQPVTELHKQDRGVWVVAAFPPRFSSRSFYIETGSFEKDFPIHIRDKQIKTLIYGFLDFWSTLTPKSEFVASEQIFSVRSGTLSPRDSAAVKDVVSRKHIQAAFASIQCGRQVWSPLEPPITWRSQPIVIEDPYLPSFNHARTLSPHASRYFHNAASVSKRTLHHGHPVEAILGHALRENRRMYSTSTLSQEMRDSYKALAPPHSVFERRKLTMSRIEKVIKKEFGNEFHVLNFGSTRYGVSVANSDLDLIIMDPIHKTGLAPEVKLSKLPRIYSVRRVGQTLASYRFSDVYIIPTASVPIVRCRDPTTGIDCDININDRLGLINTRLMENYCKLVPDIKLICLTIKRWAKYCDLNDSSGRNGPRTFSSYTLVLMVIGYLQMRGVLPNLQDGFPPLPPKPRHGVFYIRRKKEVILCDTRFREIYSSSPPVEFELGEALLGWFNFWGNEFDYARQLLSIRDGGFLERSPQDQAKFQKLRQEGTEQGGKGKEKAELDNEILTAEVNDDEAEDNAIAAWYEQEQEIEDIDEVSEGLPVDLNESEIQPFMDDTKTIVVESDASERPQSPQVKSWQNPFVILDPLVRSKNLTGHFSQALFQQFQYECRSAVELIESGGTLEDLIPADQIEEDSDDSSANKEGKKKKKGSRLGIRINPRGSPKDINKIEPLSQEQKKPKNKKYGNNQNKSHSSPTIPAVARRQVSLAGPSTLAQ